jgi:hypothetical protein
MRLQAISAGTGVPSDRFAGVVHSVFGRACNIRTDSDQLVAMLAPEHGNVPHGIRVRAPGDFAFARHLRAGQRVGCRAGVLRVAGSELAVDLRAAEIWQSGLAGLRIDLARPAVALAWQVVREALQRHRRIVRDPMLLAVQRSGQALLEASRALDMARATTAIRSLIGCGPGLTPAGDDLIVGFLAGLWTSCGDDPARRRFVRALSVVVGSAAAGTGEISRAYLWHATQGDIAEPLANLAAAIGTGAPGPAVEDAAIRALRVGHTSGGDGILGLLLGIQSLGSSGEPGHG